MLSIAVGLHTQESDWARCAARAHRDGPTVVLAKTKKGYGMGGVGESRMTSHQQKKLDLDALKVFRDRFGLALTDDALAEMRFYALPENSRELAYLRERRAALGGHLPVRQDAANGSQALVFQVVIYDLPGRDGSRHRPGPHYLKRD